MATKFVTGKVRFSYVDVFEPKSMGEGTPKYSMSVLIDKTDQATLDNINAAVKEALETRRSEWCKKNSQGKEIWPKLELPLHDGDVDKPEHEEYADKMFVNAKSTRKPVIVDKNRQAIMSNDEIYSGCYGRVYLSFYPYDFKGKKGVAVGLEMIQTYNEGERLGGGNESAENVFDEFFDGESTTEEAF